MPDLGVLVQSLDFILRTIGNNWRFVRKEILSPNLYFLKIILASVADELCRGKGGNTNQSGSRVQN